MSRGMKGLPQATLFVRRVSAPPAGRAPISDGGQTNYNALPLSELSIVPNKFSLAVLT